MAMRATTAIQRFQGMARASELKVCWRWVSSFGTGSPVFLLKIPQFDSNYQGNNNTFTSVYNVVRQCLARYENDGTSAVSNQELNKKLFYLW